MSVTILTQLTFEILLHETILFKDILNCGLSSSMSTKIA